MASIIAIVCPPRGLNDEDWSKYAAVCAHIAKRFKPFFGKERERLADASTQARSIAAYDAVRAMVERRDRLFARLSKGR